MATVKGKTGRPVNAGAPGNQPLEPLFGRQNLMMIIVGMVVIAIGMLLMSGGKNPDPNVFDNNLVYGFRRITLAPIVILLGFAIEIVAIFWREKK